MIVQWSSNAQEIKRGQVIATVLAGQSMHKTMLAFGLHPVQRQPVDIATRGPRYLIRTSDGWATVLCSKCFGVK